MNILNAEEKKASLIKLSQIENGEAIRNTLQNVNNAGLVERMNTKSNYIQNVIILDTNRISLNYIPIKNTVRVFINGILYTSDCYTVNYEEKYIEWTDTELVGDLLQATEVTVVYDYDYAVNEQLVTTSSIEVTDLRENYRKKADKITEDDLSNELKALLNFPVSESDITALRNRVSYVENKVVDIVQRDDLLFYRNIDDKITYNDLDNNLKNKIDNIDSSLLTTVNNSLLNKEDKSTIGSLSDLDSSITEGLENINVVSVINALNNKIGTSGGNPSSIEGDLTVEYGIILNTNNSNYTLNDYSEIDYRKNTRVRYGGPGNEIIVRNNPIYKNHNIIYNSLFDQDNTTIENYIADNNLTLIDVITLGPRYELTTKDSVYTPIVGNSVSIKLSIESISNDSYEYKIKLYDDTTTSYISPDNVEHEPSYRTSDLNKCGFILTWDKIYPSTTNPTDYPYGYIVIKAIFVGLDSLSSSYIVEDYDTINIGFSSDEEYKAALGISAYEVGD